MLNKEEHDQLYHLLRRISINENPVEIECVKGLTSHLLGGGDYPGLLKYLGFYGDMFLLSRVVNELKNTEWGITRFVEIGSGYGWLSRGLSGMLGLGRPLCVDKRPWAGVDVVLDLEYEDINPLTEQMRNGDVVIASSFLHCVTNGADILVGLSPWPVVVLEFDTESKPFGASFVLQVSKFGGDPVSTTGLTGQFGGRMWKTVNLYPYKLFLLEKMEDI